MRVLRVAMVLLLAAVVTAGFVQLPSAWAAPCCSSCDRAFDRCVDKCLAQGNPLGVCFDLCEAQVFNCYGFCILSC